MSAASTLSRATHVNFSRRGAYDNLHMSSTANTPLPHNTTLPDAHLEVRPGGPRSRDGLRRSSSEPFLASLGTETPKRMLTTADHPGQRRTTTSNRRSLTKRRFSIRSKKNEDEGIRQDETRSQANVYASKNLDADTVHRSEGTKRDLSSERSVNRLSASLTRLSRRSWALPSRSPPVEETCSNVTTTVTVNQYPQSITGQNNEFNWTISANQENNESHGPRPIESSYDSRIEDLKGLINLERQDREASPLPPVPRLPSVTRSSSPSSSYASSEHLPGLPKSLSLERLQSNRFDRSRKRDELWSTFRTLDGELQK